jgi:hypothetical protein
LIAGPISGFDLTGLIFVTYPTSKFMIEFDFRRSEEKIHESKRIYWGDDLAAGLVFYPGYGGLQ